MDTLKIDLKNITVLQSLPSCLVELYCGYNNLTELPNLPATLRTLNCPHNALTRLPKLPALTVLDITANHIVKLRPPDTLVILYCSFNPRIEMTLPAGLKELHCCSNQLTSLSLPSKLEILYCSYNGLKTLMLPPGLKELICDHNFLKRLDLPTSLTVLDCVDNRLTTLTLPPDLQEASCSHNRLTSLVLNKRVTRVNLSHNPILVVPALHPGIVFLNLNHTLIEQCFKLYPPLDQGGLYVHGTPLYAKMKAVLDFDVFLTPDMIKLSFEMITMIEEKFKENYYGLKVRDPLRSWMWRARDTLARRKYHPDELWKMLEQDDYVDAVEQWE